MCGKPEGSRGANTIHIERDHQHLKGRLRPTRGFKTLTGARVLDGKQWLLTQGDSDIDRPW